MIWWPVTMKTATLSGWDKKILKLSAKYVGLQFYVLYEWNCFVSTVLVSMNVF